LPAVEEYGVDPVPAELRTVGWRDLFAINFTFFLNPVMYVLGALAVSVEGLPLLPALGAALLGQALAFACLALIAEPGVDYGLPGQVAMRASLGQWGARGLSSPYRVVASTYWFAAQALAGGLGLQAVIRAMGGGHVSLVPLAIALGFVHAALAILGFDLMRYVLRVVLPLSLALTGVLVGLYLTSSDPRFAPSHVLGSGGRHFTWVGFATYVTVMCGASLTLVTSVADICRYTRSRRDMRVGLVASSLASVALTTFVGAYAAVATGATNPFVAVVDLTSSTPLLVLLGVAIVVQGLAANVTNVYTAGLSLVNSIPPLGRLRATVAVAAGAVALSALPSVVDRAQTWITNLGNLAAPLTGALLADWLLLQRRQLHVPSLYDPAGRYRYLNGINPVALAAVAAGAIVYYAVPQASLKAVWGIATAAAVQLALSTLRDALRAPAGAPAMALSSESGLEDTGLRVP
jgi:NCS1 family nucleobase:cation symporter-1